MKHWFIFGSGLFLGTVLGAYLTAIIFFDDVTKGPQSTAISTVSVKEKMAVAKSVSKKAESVNALPIHTASLEERPVSVAALPVDPSSLSAEPTVISTAKRDDAADSQSTQ